MQFKLDGLRKIRKNVKNVAWMHHESHKPYHNFGDIGVTSYSAKIWAITMSMGWTTYVNIGIWRKLAIGKYCWPGAKIICKNSCCSPTKRA